MDLTYTDKQKAFREEVRTWLAANVPAEPLQSFDTEVGFQQHRDWEAQLNSGRWGMVTWPEELGGRACDLIEWLIFEEEYWRAGAPLRGEPEWDFSAGADADGVRHRGTESAHFAENGNRGRSVGAGLVRAQCRFRYGSYSRPGRAAGRQVHY